MSPVHYAHEQLFYLASVIPVLNAVERLVIVGEETMDVPQFTICMRSSFTWPMCSCAACS
jgi:hypothetical protein